MRILVHGLNYAPEQVGIAVYTTGMAEALVRMGHEVRVVSGQPYYPQWRVMAGHKAWVFSRHKKAGVDVVRVPHYIPRWPTGARRVLHHLSFAVSSFWPLAWHGLVWRPDVVIAIAPSLIGAPVARLTAALAGARSWLHLQDFELEAAVATGVLRTRRWISHLASLFEQGVLRSFDTVSTISPQMCKRLIEKGIAAERVTEFRNWADADVRPLSYSPKLRAEWEIPTPHVALYSGNIANKQGVEIVVEAARLLQHRRDLTFVVCGEGSKRVEIEALAGGLENIRFHDLVRKERLSELLGLASVHLLPQRAEAADLVLPSKLTNMLASGRPVVATAAAGTGLAHEVEGCGLVTSPGDAAAFAAAIVRLLDDRALHSEMSAAARTRAVTRWSEQAILAEFETRLTEGRLDAAELVR